MLSDRHRLWLRYGKWRHFVGLFDVGDIINRGIRTAVSAGLDSSTRLKPSAASGSANSV